MAATGEALHKIGADGADAARRWLNSTMRAKVYWVRPEPISDERLSFVGANGSPFSFDLGGLLQGDDQHGMEFLGEVKNVSTGTKQGVQFKDFLAKCYRTYRLRPERCGCFYWITWLPFSAESWHSLDNPESVRIAVKENWKINFETEAAVDSELDESVVTAVSDRVWKIVLSDYQIEKLTMSNEHRAIIVEHEVRRGRE